MYIRDHLKTAMASDTFFSNGSPTHPSALYLSILLLWLNSYPNLYWQYSSPPEGVKATARHILVKSQDDVAMILDQLQQGEAKFADLARQYSTCPSASQGGSLGSFGPGTMVKEFDKVIFSPETQIGTVVGPVQTQVP